MSDTIEMSREELDELMPLSGTGPILREFVGTFLTWEVEANEQYGGFNRKLIYDDLEVIETAEGTIWEFPAADITVKHPKLNKWKKISMTNAFSVLQQSFSKLVPEGKRWSDFEGKRYRMKYTDGHPLTRMVDVVDESGSPVLNDDGEVKKKFETKPGYAWEAVELIGASSNGSVTAATGAELVALSLIDGLTKQKFQIEALKREEIKGDNQFRAKILNGAWLKEMLEAGKVTLSLDGIYRKV